LYYGAVHRVFGDESYRVFGRPNGNSSSLPYLARISNTISSQQSLVTGVGEPLILVQRKKGRVVQDPINSRELSTPRFRIGLLDSDDLELSPIRPYHDTQPANPIRKVSIMYGASHLAEKAFERNDDYFPCHA
jgi:hypothetical protein